MTDPAAAVPAPPGEPARGQSSELGWALHQMAGLVLSRETVGTALELVMPYLGGVGNYRKLTTEIAEDGYRGFTLQSAEDSPEARTLSAVAQ